MRLNPLYLLIVFFIYSCNFIDKNSSSLTEEEFITRKVDPILEKISALSNADWGYNTDLQAVFDVILETAKNKNLGNDNLPEKVYIVSDMEFDSACENNENSNYTTIKKKFEAEGFKCPELPHSNSKE